MILAFLGLPDHAFSDCVAFFLFAVCLILGVSYAVRFIDWAWPKLDLELEVNKGNMAAGVVMAAVVVGLCYALAKVAVAIIGG